MKKQQEKKNAGSTQNSLKPEPEKSLQCFIFAQIIALKSTLPEHTHIGGGQIPYAQPVFPAHNRFGRPAKEKKTDEANKTMRNDKWLHLFSYI